MLYISSLASKGRQKHGFLKCEVLKIMVIKETVLWSQVEVISLISWAGVVL